MILQRFKLDMIALFKSFPTSGHILDSDAKRKSYACFSELKGTWSLSLHDRDGVAKPLFLACFCFVLC